MKKFNFKCFLLIGLLMTTIIGCKKIVPDPEEMVTDPEKIIEVIVGEDVYFIPKKYLEPVKGRRPKRFDSKGLVVISLFLPEYRGYKYSNEKHRLVGAYNKNRVLASWGETGVYGSDTNKILPKMLSYKTAKRDISFDKYGLEGYPHISTINQQVSYIGSGEHGSLLLIVCAEVTENWKNPICKASYFHKEKNIEIFFYFDLSYLESWKEIDRHINLLIDEWKIKTDEKNR